MPSVSTTKPIHPDQFIDANPSVTELRIHGEFLSNDEKEVEVSGLSQGQLQAAVDAFTFDPSWKPTPEERDWSSLLQAEIDFIASQVASWPPDATTNAQAIQRVNFLLTAVKRVARNQQRILAFIRDNSLDTES